MPVVLTVAGGVALILFGVGYLRKGLDRLFGRKLAPWMQRITRDRWRAFLGGLGISILTPSSTTISVLAVQTVQAGQMTARQMLAVVFGADLGLTVMVLLIALRAERLAPLLVLLGVLIYQISRSAARRGLGQVLLALGLIFIAIGIIKSAALTAAGNNDFIEMMHILEHYPAGLAGAAVVLAFALQSSTATIGMVVGLAAVGAVQLPAATAVVAGANVGIVLTTLIVGWGQVESRRLALGNLLAKAVTAGIVLATLQWSVPWLARLPGGPDRQVAYAHILFNALLATLFVPLVGPLHALTTRLVRAGHGDEPFGPRYIGKSPPDSVAVALGQSRREILRVSEIDREMLEDLWLALERDDEALAERVSQRDDEIDLLDTHIKRFLTQLVSLDPTPEEAAEQMLQLRYLNELETIGDILDKNLSELAVKKSRLGVAFSTEGRAELADFHRRVAENMLIAQTAFLTRDRMLAQQLLRHKDRMTLLESQLRDRHFARLNAGLPTSHESSAIHLDVLTHLKRINSAVSHVAYAILQNVGGEQAPVPVPPAPTGG